MGLMMENLTTQTCEIGGVRFVASCHAASRRWICDSLSIVNYLNQYEELCMHQGRFFEYPFVFTQIINSKKQNAETILDIGAGKGAFGQVMSEMGYRVTAIDDYGEGWDDLKKYKREHSIDIVDCSVFDISKKFGPGAFDYALMISVIEHIPSSMICTADGHKTPRMTEAEIPVKRSAIAEALKAVKPQGKIIFTTDYYLDYPDNLNMDWGKILGFKGIDKDFFRRNIDDLYIYDLPHHKGRIVHLGFVLERRT